MFLTTVTLLLAMSLHQTAAEIYALQFESTFFYEEFEDVEAMFGPKITDGILLRGMLHYAEAPYVCSKIQPPPNNTENEISKWIILLPRYTMTENCTFEQNVRYAQAAGYDAVIIHNVLSNHLIPMSAQNKTGIVIPSVFVSELSGFSLKMYASPTYYLVITGVSPFNIQTHLLIPFAIVVGICFIVMIVFMIIKFVKDRRRQRRYRLPVSTLKKIPTCKFQTGDPYETCAICLDDYVEGEKLRILPCNHAYHTKCIDPWLTKNRRVCPICKRKVFAHDEPYDSSDSDSDADDTTPLLRPTATRTTQGGTFDHQNESPIQRAVRSISQQSGAQNFVTASDHHSINGERVSVPSSSSSDSSEKSDENECDNVEELHVHIQPQTLDETKPDIV